MDNPIKKKKKIETPFAPFPLETFYCLSYSLPILKWYDLKLLVEQFQKRRDLETASATIVGVFKTGQENRSGVKETEPCPQLVQWGPERSMHISVRFLLPVSSLNRTSPAPTFGGGGSYRQNSLFPSTDLTFGIPGANLHYSSSPKLLFVGLTNRKGEDLRSIRHTWYESLWPMLWLQALRWNILKSSMYWLNMDNNTDFSRGTAKIKCV